MAQKVGTIIATPDMFPMSELPEPRICGGALGGCGGQVELDDDAAVHEYLLSGATAALTQPTHHLMPVYDGDRRVCDGFPMVARHFSAMASEDLGPYEVEDPNSSIHNAYIEAYNRLTRFAAYKEHLAATAVEAAVEVETPSDKANRRIAALFKTAASYLV